MKKIASILVFIICASTTIAQRASYTISGYVTDVESGERLIGAAVFDTLSRQGTVTNTAGFYTLTLPANRSCALVATYVGYAPSAVQMVDSSQTIPFALMSTTHLQEVTVTGHASVSAPENVQMSAIEVPVNQILAIPAIGGEVDVLKAIQLLPGVQSASEGSSGVYVRGGGPDENLILLDGVPLYNVSHAMGMFSVFNADIMESVTLYKGNFPARYGSRLSSVIDVEQTSGGNTMWHGGISVGLISAKLHVQGPIFTGKQLRERKLSQNKDTIVARTTFAISARRTYFDALLSPVMAAVSAVELDGGSAMGGYYFYDVNAKLSHRFKNNDRLSVSMYMGDDVIYVHYNTNESYSSSGTRTWEKTKMSMRWTSGNLMARLQYQHRLRDNLKMQAHLHFLRFGYDLSEAMDVDEIETTTGKASNTYSLDQTFDYRSKLMDMAAHTDWLFEEDRHSVHFGAGYELHTFRPQIGSLTIAEMGISQLSFDTTYSSGTTLGHEAYVYAEDTYTPVKWFTLNYGMRASLYCINGKVYPSAEPRIGMRFLLHKDVALKASYSYMSQYVHLLSNTSISSPTNLWVPVTKDIPPMRSMQVAAGLSYDILGQAELSVEGYYKRSTNLVEYKEGASFFGISTGWEEKVALGDGWSYGVELLLQRKCGPVTGWIGYTWSRTMRQFDREGMLINDGKPYHAKYDREHDLRITLQYRITPKFEIAGTFVYGTGNGKF